MMKLPDAVTVELWDVCCQYCSPSTLLSLGLTCRLFRDITLPLIFRKITFKEWRLGLRLNERWLSDHPGILKHLSGRLEGLATNSGLALNVRELSFDAFPDPSCKFPDKVVLDAGDIVKGFLLDYRALLLDFVKYLPRFNLVETISLSDLKINHEILMALSQLPALTMISMSNGKQVRLTPDSVKHVSFQVLSTLVLYADSKNIAGIFYLLETCPNLETLDLRRHNLSGLNNTFPSLPSSVCPNLRTFWGPPGLAILIIPGRPIEFLHIVHGDSPSTPQITHDSEIHPILPYLGKSTGPVRVLSLPKLGMNNSLELISNLLPGLRILTVDLVFFFNGTDYPTPYFREDFWDWLAEGRYPLPANIQELEIVPLLHFTNRQYTSWSQYLGNNLPSEIYARHKKALALLGARYPSLTNVNTAHQGPHWMKVQGEWTKS